LETNLWHLLFTLCNSRFLKTVQML